jgi:hypothetical protein
VLFSTLPDDARDLDKIAKVASNMREGSKVFANPSGTTQASASTSPRRRFVTALLTGQVGRRARSPASPGSQRRRARLMTSPTVVHWLAETTKAPVEQLPAQLNQLFQHSLYMKADERRDVREFVKDARD